MERAMNVLVFDIFAQYGHFKIPYTTTSPLTLPVPSKTAIYGIIGAIIGLDKNDYLSQFQEEVCRIAIGIKKPIKKTHLSENLINTKNVGKSAMFARMKPRKAAPRTQVKIEFLKEPGYRIYIGHDNKTLMEEMNSLIKEHKSVYTVSLGLSECLANFEYIGFYQTEYVKDNREFVSFNSILPLEFTPSTDNIKLDDDKYFIRTHLPLEMKPDRELLKTGDFLIEVKGKTITARVHTYHKIIGLNESILLF